MQDAIAKIVEIFHCTDAHYLRKMCVYVYVCVWMRKTSWVYSVKMPVLLPLKLSILGMVWDGNCSVWNLLWCKTTDSASSSPTFPFFCLQLIQSVSLGVGSVSVSLGCSLESTNVFPRDKNKRRVMTIFVTLHPKWNFMGQREETSVARRDFLCWMPNTFYKQLKCERFSK